MTKVITRVGVNIIGVFNSAKKPVKTAPLARGLLCPSRETIVKSLVLANTMMGLDQMFKLPEEIVVSPNILVI